MHDSDKSEPEQDNPGEPPNGSANGGNKHTKPQPNSDSRHSKKPRRDFLDWLNFFVLLFAFGAAAYAARYAEKSAQHTKDAVRLAQNTAERQLRAYLIADKPALSDLKAGELTAGYAIENIGQTPAYDLEQRLIIDVFPYPLPDKLNVKWTTLNVRAYLGKTLTFGGIRTKNFTDQEIKAIRAALDKRLYVIGETTYHDIYGIERPMNFCFMYVNDPNAGPDLYYCDVRNNADQKSR